jgi:hypothetical protein
MDGQNQYGDMYKLFQAPSPMTPRIATAFPDPLHPPCHLGVMNITPRHLHIYYLSSLSVDSYIYLDIPSPLTILPLQPPPSPTSINTSRIKNYDYRLSRLRAFRGLKV